MYRVETHCHTLVSDGMMSPRELVRLARRRGLDAVIVTDHNTFRGAMLAGREAGGGRDPLVVYGNELRTLWGDIVVACPEPHDAVPPWARARSGPTSTQRAASRA